MMTKIKKIYFIIIVLFSIFWFGTVRLQVKTGSALDLNDLDTTVDPNVDFYEYSNGKMKIVEIVEVVEVNKHDY